MTRGQLSAGMWKCLPFLTSHAHASPSTPYRTGDDLVLHLHTCVQLLGFICPNHCRAGDCESPWQSCLAPQGERISKELHNTCLNMPRCCGKEQCCCSGCAPRARSSVCQCRQRGQGAGLADNHCFIFLLYWIRYNLDLFSSFARDKNKR